MRVRAREGKGGRGRYGYGEDAVAAAADDDDGLRNSMDDGWMDTYRLGWQCVYSFIRSVEVLKQRQSPLWRGDGKDTKATRKKAWNAFHTYSVCILR